MTFMFLALAQLTNKAFTDAGKGRIRQSLSALVKGTTYHMLGDRKNCIILISVSSQIILWQSLNKCVNIWGVNALSRNRTSKCCQGNHYM